MAENDFGVDLLRLRLSEGAREETLEFGAEADVSIGRSDDCEVRLETQKASRQHARIACQDGRYVVIDLASANGTFLNGVRVRHQSVLFLGDVLSVGVANIRVDSGPTAGRADAEHVPHGVSSSTPDSPCPEKAPGPAMSSRASLVGSICVIAVGLFLLFLAAWKVSGFGPLFEPVKNTGEMVLGDGAAEDDASTAPPLQRSSPDAAAGQAPSLPDALAPRGDSSATVDTEMLDPEAANDTALEAGQGANTLAALLEQLVSGASGWTAVRQLREAVDQNFADPDSEFARRLLPVLEGLEHGARGERRAAADARVDSMLEEKAFGEALSAVSALDVLESDDHWKERAAQIDLMAREDLEVAERKLSELTAAGRSGEAVLMLAQMKERYGFLSGYDETLSNHVKEALNARAGMVVDDPQATQLASPEALVLKDHLAVAFEECRFDEMSGFHYALLTMDPEPAERIELLNGLVDAALMERMFAEFLTDCAERPPAISPYPGEIGRITSADATTVQFELDINGVVGAYNGKVAWRGLTFSKKFELFSRVTLTPQALLGVSAYAFRCGYEEGAHATLLRLRKRSGFRLLADAFFAAHIGERVPDGGFVEYRKRLVTPAYRDAEIVRRNKIKKEEAAARAEIRRLKQDSKLGAYLEIAKRYRQRGLFQLGHAVLNALARRFPSTEAGVAAKELVGDPILNLRDLKVTGRAENRLDIYLLGEGYPLDDEYQESFFNRATAALDRLLKDEPYREYQSYFNYYAVALASKDRGLDRHPGGIRRDTALNGKVEWDRFTVERSKVYDVLSRVGEGGKDRQAIVIGNEHAGVATGGGGVACVSKGSLNALPHEIGHSLANLHDEYDLEPGTNPGRHVDNTRDPNMPTSPFPPNLMRGSEREDVLANARWRYWIDAGVERSWNGAGVSVFQGGNRRRFNYWRPQANCKMRAGFAKFCVVCMETMMKAIYRHVRPIDRVEPEAREIVLTPDETKSVRIWPMKPRTHFLDVSWRLFTDPTKNTEDRAESEKMPREVELTGSGRRIETDGRPVEIVVLRGRDLEPGRYRLQATVSDPTPWVLRDDQGLLTERREWIVVIGEETKNEE